MFLRSQSSVDLQRPYTHFWRFPVAGLAAAFLVVGCGAAQAEDTAQTPTASAPPSEPEHQEPDHPPAPPAFEAVETVDLTQGLVLAGEVQEGTGIVALPNQQYLVTLGTTGEFLWVQSPGESQPVTGPGAESIALEIAGAAQEIAEEQSRQDQLETDPTMPHDPEFPPEDLPADPPTSEGPNGDAPISDPDRPPVPGVYGVTVSPTFEADGLLYVFVSTGTESHVVTVTWANGEMGPGKVILSDLPAGAGRNGGALGFGPDGYLFVSVGDAGQPQLAQDLDSLAGKILRVAPDGSMPGNNPLTNSALWSLGHRNVTDFTWTDQGQMYAVEPGQAIADELNLITPGANYGWPIVEGRGFDEDKDPHTNDLGPDGDATEDQDSENDQTAQHDNPATTDTEPADSETTDTQPGDAGNRNQSADADPTQQPGPGPQAAAHQITAQEAVSRGLTPPVLQWQWSSQALTAGDPVAIVATDEGLYVTGFNGERLWRIGLLEHGLGTAQEFFAHTLGPLRGIALGREPEPGPASESGPKNGPGPESSLVVLTGITAPNPGAGSIPVPAEAPPEGDGVVHDRLIKFKVTY